MLDRYWFGEVDRISPEAPVPIVAVRETDERLGGAANVVRNMTALGSQAGLLAVLGRDEAATCVRHLLAESAIAAHLHEDNRLATTVKLRILGRRQQMLCADFESLPDRDMLLEHLGNYRCLLGKYDLIVLSDYGKGGLDLPGFFGPMISGKMALRQ
jgi:rfaE bifunctional protein kinase chain/domain